MMTKKRSTQQTVRDIRRATRRHYSAEEKIRIVRVTASLSRESWLINAKGFSF